MKIGFIGAGNMGGALAKAISKSMPSCSLYISDRNDDKIKALLKDINFTVSDNEEIAEECDLIFFGVKPGALSSMIDSIKCILEHRKSSFTIVSMAAGVTIEKLEKYLGFPCSIIRIMPNTPVSVGEGIVLWSANEHANETAKQQFCQTLSAAGILDELDEHLIDAGCALSGCGPAFVYMFISALADGAVECGLPRNKALEYAAQTLVGSARLALESDKHPEALKDAVCSPGGSTIAGVHALESGAFRAAVMNAVNAAFDRTRKLGK